MLKIRDNIIATILNSVLILYSLQKKLAVEYD